MSAQAAGFGGAGRSESSDSDRKCINEKGGVALTINVLMLGSAHGRKKDGESCLASTEIIFMFKLCICRLRS